jgi:hypothetical protein
MDDLVDVYIEGLLQLVGNLGEMLTAAGGRTAVAPCWVTSPVCDRSR